MNSQREEQVIALNEISSYVSKLVKNIPVLAAELRGKEKSDTGEFLQQMIQGLGWVIEVVNTIMPLLNEEKERISKEEMNEAILSLNDGLGTNDYKKIADALEKSVQKFLEELLIASREIK